MTRSARYGAMAAVASALTLAACDKKDDGPALAPTASTLAPSVASGPASAKSAKFAIDSACKTAIDMPAPKEHIKADTSAATGSLDLDVANLASTRGEVRIDLATLKTHTFDDAKQDTTQTEHALTWLEIGPTASADQREGNRWAVFAIRSIDGVSFDLKAPPTKEGADDVRVATLTAHGDFLLHGHKVAKDAVLDVKLHFPAGAPADSKPTSVDIASKTPLHIVLAEHDVKPRDNEGKLAQTAFSLLGTKVAETADVSLAIHATPAS